MTKTIARKISVHRSRRFVRVAATASCSFPSYNYSCSVAPAPRTAPPTKEERGGYRIIPRSFPHMARRIFLPSPHPLPRSGRFVARPLSLPTPAVAPTCANHRQRLPEAFLHPVLAAAILTPPAHPSTPPCAHRRPHPPTTGRFPRGLPPARLARYSRRAHPLLSRAPRPAHSNAADDHFPFDFRKAFGPLAQPTPRMLVASPLQGRCSGVFVSGSSRHVLKLYLNATSPFPGGALQESVGQRTFW